MTGQEFQGDEVAIEDRSMSGAHPMHKRPKVMEGPYAVAKTRIGQQAFDDNAFGDEERTRRAEYECLKVRLESVYRQKAEEVHKMQKIGREVSGHAVARMSQAYQLLQGRSEVNRWQIADESAAMKQCIQDLENQATMKRREADEINLLPMPTIATFRSWKIALRNEVACASGDPDNGFKWITEVERQGANLAHLYESTPFRSLDAKIAASLTKIITGELARQIYILTEERSPKASF